MKDEWIKGKEVSIKDHNKPLCPLIHDLYKECFCSSLSSQSIDAAIYYCSSGHFEECEIYKRKRHL